MYPNKPRYGRQINTYVVIMFVDVGVSSFAYPLELLVATRIYLSLCHCRRVSLVLNLYDVFCFCVLFQDNVLAISCSLVKLVFNKMKCCNSSERCCCFSRELLHSKTSSSLLRISVALL
jgi:hypothetical protein